MSGSEEHRRRFRWPLVVLSAVLLAGAGAGAAAYFLHSTPTPRHSAGARSAGVRNGLQPAASFSTPVSATESSSPAVSSPAQSPQQQGAASLAALLARSVSDRSSVVNAVSDVGSCGPRLGQDAQTFASAAASRQQLLSQLAGLPGRTALPAPMLQALASAWRASVEADDDFAQWARDEASQGCTPNDHADPGYQAATGPDTRATLEKKAFAGLWNPLAAQYALTPYQWDEL